MQLHRVAGDAPNRHPSLLNPHPSLLNPHPAPLNLDASPAMLLCVLLRVFPGDDRVLCVCVRVQEDVIRAHICFRYNTLKSRLALVQARLQDIESLIKVRASPSGTAH
jgi:hypothetical protein